MHIIITLLIGGLIGSLANLITGERGPKGIISCILIGFIGSLLGKILIGSWGPTIEGFYIFPALIGSLLLILIYILFKKFF
ncbi:GlsB/YeaQ/YmgE family stress response membrane protein [Bacillus cereus]